MKLHDNYMPGKMLMPEMVASRPAAPERPGPGSASELSPGPAPVPSALSPKDTQDSAQYRASKLMIQSLQTPVGFVCSDCFAAIHRALVPVPIHSR